MVYVDIIPDPNASFQVMRINPGCARQEIYPKYLDISG